MQVTGLSAVHFTGKTATVTRGREETISDELFGAQADGSALASLLLAHSGLATSASSQQFKRNVPQPAGQVSCPAIDIISNLACSEWCCATVQAATAPPF